MFDGLVELFEDTKSGFENLDKKGWSDYLKFAGILMIIGFILKKVF